jgi:hypothetical protein
MLAEKIAVSEAQRQQEEEDDDDDFDNIDYFSADDFSHIDTDRSRQLDDDISSNHIDLTSSLPLLPPRAQYNFAAATQASRSKARALPRATTAERRQAKVDKAKAAVDKAVAQADKAMKAAQLAQEKLQHIEAEADVTPSNKRSRAVAAKEMISRKRNGRDNLIG